VTADALGGQREAIPASLSGGAPFWDAMSSAVALVTRLRQCPEVPRSAVPGARPAAEILPAMEVLAAALLETAYPGDQGAAALRALGLLAAERAAQDPARAPQ